MEYSAEWRELPRVTHGNNVKEFFPYEIVYQNPIRKVSHIRISTDGLLFLHEVRVFNNVPIIPQGKLFLLY